MIYLIIGHDVLAKDKNISELKDRYLSTFESENLDYETFNSHKLDPDILKQSLIALPIISKYRLVVLRSVEKLSTHNKNLLLSITESLTEKTILILDADVLDGKTTFYKKMSVRSKLIRVKSFVKRNVFDVTNAMERNRVGEALRILTQLIEEGQHPLQIMGVLIWFWGKMKTCVKQETFNKGLLAFQKADSDIKRSRVNPKYALEILLTKLCLLKSY